jgi:outer membrane immunogenic protein
MRSFTAWVAGATMLALTGATHAADLGGGYPSYKDETPFVRQFNWSGAYVGAQLGYAWSDVDARDFDAGAIVPNGVRYGYDVDGGYLGFNWQTQGLVLGLEADVEYTDLGDRDRTRSHFTDVDWMGSVRGRLGFVADRALFYVTGGWGAFADVDTRNTSLTAGPLSYGDIRHGWTLGAGTEYAFTDNLIGRFEYRYSDFGSDSIRAANGDIDRSDLDMHAIRAGLAFKF